MRPDRESTCAWCGAEFRTPSRRGPAPIYCSPAHRQAAYKERWRVEAEQVPIRRRGIEGRVEALEGRVAALAEELEALRAGGGSTVVGGQS